MLNLLNWKLFGLLVFVLKLKLLGVGLFLVVLKLNLVEGVVVFWEGVVFKVFWVLVLLNLLKGVLEVFWMVFVVKVNGEEVFCVDDILKVFWVVWVLKVFWVGWFLKVFWVVFWFGWDLNVFWVVWFLNIFCVVFCWICELNVKLFWVLVRFVNVFLLDGFLKVFVVGCGFCCCVLNVFWVGFWEWFWLVCVLKVFWENGFWVEFLLIVVLKVFCVDVVLKFDVLLVVLLNGFWFCCFSIDCMFVVLNVNLFWFVELNEFWVVFEFCLKLFGVDIVLDIELFCVVLVKDVNGFWGGVFELLFDNEVGFWEVVVFKVEVFGELNKFVLGVFCVEFWFKLIVFWVLLVIVNVNFFWLVVVDGVLEEFNEEIVGKLKFVCWVELVFVLDVFL